MKSVADELRAMDREEALRLSPTERLARAIELGRRDLELFRKSHGLSVAAALQALRRRRASGRRPSVVNEPDE